MTTGKGLLWYMVPEKATTDLPFCPAQEGEWNELGAKLKVRRQERSEALAKMLEKDFGYDVPLDELRKLHRSMDFNPPGSGFPIYLYFTRWGLIKFKAGLFWIGVREFFRKRKAFVRDRLNGSYRAQRKRAKLRDIME